MCGRLSKHKKDFLKNYTIEKSTEKISSRNIIELKTGKSHIIKILFECIKNFLNETNIVFTHDTITISNCDSYGNVYIFLELKAKEFEHYFCDEKRIIGIDVIDLYKISKTTTSSDVLSIFVEYDNPDELIIITENKDSKEVIENRLKTLDLGQDSLSIPAMEFDSQIVFLSQKFQKICKDFESFKVQELEIRSINTQVILSAYKGGEIARKVVLNSDTVDNDKSTIIIPTYEQDNIYRGIFKLSYFTHFVKATPLCDKVYLYISNDKPLVIEYNVTQLGSLKFIVNPINGM